jgi:phosphoadenosine phosphosulfate reductase
MSTALASRDRTELQELVLTAAARLEGKAADEIVEWALGEFGERFCVTSSFADAVLVHVVSKVAPGIEVVFLDTGLHFAETLRVREIVQRTLPVTVRSVRPEQTVGEQAAEHGPKLWARNPDECCALRKVEPLEEGLREYDAWATGLRRDESPTRANTPVVGWDAKRRKVKVSPIARWTQGDVDAYVAEHGVLTNPLLMDGYPSVGCAPCTRRVLEGEDARSGRWSGSTKTECGLHG